MSQATTVRVVPFDLTVLRQSALVWERHLGAHEMSRALRDLADRLTPMVSVPEAPK